MPISLSVGAAADTATGRAAASDIPNADDMDPAQPIARCRAPMSAGRYTWGRYRRPMPGPTTPPPGSDPVLVARKGDLRRRLVAARRVRSAADRAAAGQQNSAHLAAVLQSVGIVCGYLPLPSEPLDAVLWDQLTGAGVR